MTIGLLDIFPQSGSGSNINNLTGYPLTVAHGGTGKTFLTPGGVLVSNTTGTGIDSIPLLAGQVLIGEGPGIEPVASTLTEGPGIIITSVAGSITISSTAAATTYDGNSGSATPSGGILSIIGTGGNITTSGNGGSTISIAFSGTLPVADGGTGATTLSGVLTGNGTGAITANPVTQFGVVVGGLSNAVSSTAVGATGTVLQGNTGAAPTYSTATYPSTTTANQILYSSATNTVTGLSTANNGVLITSTTGVPSILADGTTGQVLTATTGGAPSWASPATSGTVTSVSVVSANGFAGTVATATSTPAITLTTTATGVLSGNGTAISGSAITQFDVLVGGAANAITSITNGTTGQVFTATTGGNPGWTTLAASGVTSIAGTADQIAASASTGAVTLSLVGPYTPATYTAHTVIVGEGTSSMVGVGPGSSGQILQSGGASADPAYTTATYPGTTTANQLLYSSATNVVGGLATADNGVLITSATGVPSFLANSSTTGYVLTATATGPNWEAIPVLTIDGDTGSASPTGSTIDFYASTNGADAGSSVTFNAGSLGSNIVELVTTDANFNTMIGLGAGNSGITGTDNTALGYQALTSLTSGRTNTAVGYQALNASTGSVACVAVGSMALMSNQGIDNTAIGAHALMTSTTGTSNTAVGSRAMQMQTPDSTPGDGSASQNTAVGFSALENNVTGQNNVAIGALAASNVLIGAGSSFSNIVAVGASALAANQVDFNVAIGSGSLASNTTGTNNTAVGYSTFGSLTTGSSNIAIGSRAGMSYASSESSNIIIGNLGTVGESNVLRIGTQGSGVGDQNMCYIAGITGVTVTGAAVMCSGTGQLGTIVSSARYKENIVSLDSDSGFLNLRPVSFSYKSDATKVIHYGLIAEEVEKTFPSLVIYNDKGQPDSVAYHEMPALLLMEIQKLKEEIEVLKKKIV